MKSQLPQIKYIAYLSKQRYAMSDGDMTELLNNSRRNNIKNGITGMLVYIDGSFVQFIEGEPIAINDLYSRIQKDRRHDALVMIEEGTIIKRNFGGWSMAFKKLDGQRLNTLTGYRPFDPDLLFDYPTDQEEKLPALVLLQNFIRDLQE